jgi:cobalt/nickel transport system permease protein
MHIPDGYLSPLTVLFFYLIMIPFWYLAGRRAQEQITGRMAPMVALLAAFSFVIMMFNVPLPGGTTGHAVGASLAAVIVGPWVATIAVSIALLIQALFFGDGGVLAFAVNSFNMAVVIPFVAYAFYRSISGESPITALRRVVAAFLGGYVGLSVAALLAGVEFGLQPLLFHAADGTPLYAPFPLSVAVPAMLIPHLAVASVIEGLVTALVVAYLQKANPGLLGLGEAARVGDSPVRRASTRALWGGLALLALLSPLGLLAAGTAWGEWGSAELGNMFGFVPRGIGAGEHFWNAPFSGYTLANLSNSLAYLFSAVAGIAITAGAVWLVWRILAARPTRTRDLP